MSSLLEKAILLHKKGSLKEAEEIYKDIYKKNTSSFEATHLLGALKIQLKDYNESINWISKALIINPESSPSYNNLGAAYLGLRKYDDALINFKKAIKIKPNYAEAYNSIGIIYTNLKKYDDALFNLRKAIEINPNYAEAYNSIGIIYTNKKEYAFAVDNYNQAIRLKPNYGEVYNNLGTAYIGLKKYDEALFFLEKNKKLKTENYNTYNYIGIAFKNLKKHDLAISNYNQAITLKPDYFEAYNNLGITYMELKDYTNALLKLKKSIEINPNYADAYNSIAVIQLYRKEYGDALISLKKAIKLKPDYAEAYNNLANAQKNLKMYELAINNYNQAITLIPNYAEAYNNLGITYIELKKHKEAFDILNEAIKFNKDYADIYNSIGVLCIKERKFEKAIENLNKSITLNPTYAEAYYNRSLAYAEIRKHNLAVLDVRKSIELDPENKYKRIIHLLGCKSEICDWKNYKKILSDIQDRILNENNIDFQTFTLLPHFDSLNLIKKQLEFNNNKILKEKNYNEINEDKKKIRIGYFSGDFKLHPVGIIISKIIEYQNKEDFEIFCFSSNPETKTNDPITNNIISLSKKYIDISTKEDEEIISIIKNLNIDIAVDLMGFTAHNKSDLFRKKIAPIQINFLGYPGTTGNYNDYIIADKNVIPEQSQKFYYEKIIYMPEFFLPNNNNIIEEHNSSREKFDLPKTGFIFASFNNTPKINPLIFNVWMRILKKVKNSILWLVIFNEHAKENLREEAQKRDVDPNRLIFSPILDFEKRLLRYKFCDLFLDTFPYNAHSTANECVWSKVPLLTLCGDSFQSRVSSSLLKNLGMEELITYNYEDYENQAIHIANSELTLTRIKNKLSEALKKTSIFDSKIYTKNLEKAYFEIYKNKKNHLKNNNIFIK